MIDEFSSGGIFRRYFQSEKICPEKYRFFLFLNDDGIFSSIVQYICMLIVLERKSRAFNYRIFPSGHHSITIALNVSETKEKQGQIFCVHSSNLKSNVCIVIWNQSSIITVHPLLFLFHNENDEMISFVLHVIIDVSSFRHAFVFVDLRINCV